MTIAEAKKELLEKQTEESAAQFAAAVRAAVDAETSVWFLTGKNDDGTFLVTYPVQGVEYAVAYSEEKIAKLAPHDALLFADINRLVEAVFTGKLGGILLDPGPQPIYLSRDFLLRALLHGLFPPQVTPRTAPEEPLGEGVPAKYDADDCLSAEELLSFAMTIVTGRDITPKGIRIISASGSVNSIPTLICEKDGEILLILIEAAVAPRVPRLDDTLRDAFVACGKKFGARCCYASVGFGSTDEARFAASLALRGDSFRTTYRGLEELS